MDHLTAQRLLAVAERNVITGKIQIARQLRVIARLKVAGYDTRLARRMLEKLRDELVVHERHRDGLQQEVLSRAPLMNLDVGDEVRVDPEPAPFEEPEETVDPAP